MPIPVVGNLEEDELAGTERVHGLNTYQPTVSTVPAEGIQQE